MVNETSLVSDKRLTVMKRLKDYKLLAFACKRAGKARDEGRAHYSTGVLYDNLGNYQAAIQSYQQFLSICKSIGDSHGEALAYNCIGVDFQKLSEQDPSNSSWVRESINYHTKHKDIADVPGKFIAHINLGVIYTRTGDVERASISNQFALRYAIQMSSVAGQSVAIGNLGQIGSYRLSGDNEKMKMFVERYLTLSNELHNRKGASGAHLQLGNLSFSQGDYGESSKQFYTAMKIAEELGDDNLVESARCNYGVANANLKMKDLMGSILEKLQP
jgi:tetratricopeptide (TPR) repeat protein